MFLHHWNHLPCYPIFLRYHFSYNTLINYFHKDTTAIIEAQNEEYAASLQIDQAKVCLVMTYHSYIHFIGSGEGCTISEKAGIKYSG